MKCPQCRKAPMSFQQFVLALGPLKTTCQNCQTELKADFFLKVNYYGVLVLGALFSLKLIGLKQTGNLTIMEMLAALLVFIMTTVFLKGVLSWKFGSYKKK